MTGGRARTVLTAVAVATSILPVGALAGGAVAARTAQSSPRSALFTFETNEFWLNLHHFLYVLGRAEAKLPDAANPAVAGALPDAERGFRSLNSEEQTAWTAAVHSYATGLSLRSNLDRAMVAVTRALADVDDAPSLAGASLDPDLLATLERAAPVYRRVWWPSHLAAIRAQNSGLHGFGIVVHEGMHQWDQAMGGTLAVQARARSVSVPRDLMHAMIFFTAGEAVRRLDAAYIPYADAFGVWKLPLSGATLPAERLKPILEEVWAPYMNGRGTRDQALGAIVEKAAAISK